MDNVEYTGFAGQGKKDEVPVITYHLFGLNFLFILSLDG